MTQQIAAALLIIMCENSSDRCIAHGCTNQLGIQLRGGGGGGGQCEEEPCLESVGDNYKFSDT